MPSRRTPEQMRILVTRPAHQAGPLCRLLRESGFRVLRFPVIGIVWRRLNDDEAVLLRTAAEQELLLFTSVNAVQGFTDLLRDRDLPVPRHLLVAAIGASTAAALHAAGFDQVLAAPPPYTSEALLALPQLRGLEGRPVMLVTGEGGRGLIARQLRQDGVVLKVLPVYRRVLPDTAAEPLRQALAEGDLHLSIVTSGEALANLQRLAGPRAWSRLQELPLLTVSERLAETAKRAGFTASILVTRASDAALVHAVVGWSEQITRGGHAHER
ncbi:uroporphyrinogen-III synthase [Methylonatrum kenyense]|uniref:uroporphyrinogen-III synthase n=1 Tax=Methylonatrum kenyense TaxID=455253 RepID=UPI0020C05A52|nr:uroporphyrinogen-III synthase [Methylonatrum kenyense]MCK8515298.1 uroporphyrinogen-III synthase [Methylonatrum kenyense]